MQITELRTTHYELRITTYHVQSENVFETVSLIDSPFLRDASLAAAIAMKITPTARRYTHQPADVKYFAVRRTVRITRASEDTLNHVLLFA